MKKIFSLIFFVFLFFFYCLEINAKTTCVYTYTEPGKSGDTGEFTIEIDYEKKELVLDYYFSDKPLLDSKLDSEWTTEKLITEFIGEGKCPTSVWGCTLIKKSSGTGKDSYTYESETDYYPLINQNLIDKLDPDEREYLFNSTNTNQKTDDTYYLVPNMCIEAGLERSESTGDAVVLDIPCDKYDEFYDSLKSIVCEDPVNFKNCSISNATSNIGNYKKIRENMRQYCILKVKYGNYTNPCVKSCLKISTDLAKIEGQVLDEFDCGISQKLGIYIANIVKWGKYLVPVIVMVLGILDFIKAIASDKEDEMKKVQGRFTKRLIAAALIFIIPFIIEFILDKMGFAANGCGIIDL